MRALVWLVENSWQATVDAARALLPDAADVTLLYVVAADVEEVVHAARAGLLGRHHPPPPPRLESISEAEAQALLIDAQARLGRSADLKIRHGRIEREVVAAAAGADLLVLARTGDLHEPGPRSVGHASRFVVDHAPCNVVLVWP